MKKQDLEKHGILWFNVRRCLFMIEIHSDGIEKRENDVVNHPSHYTDGKIEVIDFIEDKKLGYHLGNAIKYISRAGKKDDYVQDLKKAKWYLEREIQRVENDCLNQS